MDLNFSISNEDIGEIAGANDFSGFLKASDITNALATNSSLNISMVLEEESSGNINQPTEVELRSQEQIEEPQANSTLLEPEDVPVEPAKDGETGTETGKVGSDRKRIKRRLNRQRKVMTEHLSRFSTDSNRQGSLRTETSGNRTNHQGVLTPLLKSVEEAALVRIPEQRGQGKRTPDQVRFHFWRQPGRT